MELAKQRIPSANGAAARSLTDLSKQDIEEKLDEYVAFIIDKNPCQ